MTAPLPILRALLGAILLLGLATAPAQATTAAVSPDGQFLDITESAPGEINSLVAKLVTQDGRQYVEMYDNQPVQAGHQCALNPDTQITRCVDPAQTIRVSLGGGDDVFTTSEVGTGITFGEGSLTVDLGAGNDIYEGRGTNAIGVVHGGDGDDDLRGGKNPDHLFGGNGNDKLGGNESADDLHGEGGDDTLTGDGPSAFGVFGDTLDGGDGRDRLDDYVFSGDPMSAPAINVSLDGAANDGRSGENDNVTTIESIKTSSAGSFSGDDGANEFIAPQTGPAGTLNGNGGDDTLMAGDANGDTVDGGAGNDLVEGGFGDDKLVGGAGRDTVNGDRKSRCNEYACDIAVAGNDTIEVRDGEVDSVNCGPGADKVVADAADVIAADCETVDRGVIADQKPPETKDKDKTKAKASLALVKVKLGTALKKGLKIRVSNVKGTVSLKAKRGTKVMAKGSAKAKGGKATVTLKFTKAAKRSLRAKKKVSLRITGAGVTRVITLKR